MDYFRETVIPQAKEVEYSLLYRTSRRNETHDVTLTVASVALGLHDCNDKFQASEIEHKYFMFLLRRQLHFQRTLECMHACN